MKVSEISTMVYYSARTMFIDHDSPAVALDVSRDDHSVVIAGRASENHILFYKWSYFEIPLTFHYCDC